MFLPPRIFLSGLLLRGAACWAGARLLLALVGIPVAPAGVVISVAVSGLLAQLEARRRHLHLLLPNLGVSNSTIWGLHLVPPILGEAVLALVVLR